MDGSCRLTLRNRRFLRKIKVIDPNSYINNSKQGKPLSHYLHVLPKQINDVPEQMPETPKELPPKDPNVNLMPPTMVSLPATLDPVPAVTCAYPPCSPNLGNDGMYPSKKEVKRGPGRPP